MSYWTKSLLLSLFLFTSVRAEPLQRYFSDWQVTCNNVNWCEARSISGDNGLVMTLSRHAGVNDRPQLRIDYGNAYAKAPTGGSLRSDLLIDQRRLKPDLKHWKVEAHHLITSNPIAIDEFLAMVLNADSIQLNSNPQAVISLHGLKAALLLVDDIQGRVNSVSAWIRRGQRTALDIPPAPEKPRLHGHPPVPAPLTRSETSGLIDYGTWRIATDECSLEPMRREIKVTPLTDSKALILVSCEMGAYNVIDLAFEVTRSQPYVARGLRLTLPFTMSGQRSRQLELINAEYDPFSGKLYTFYKGRGLGDCGVATRWLFDGTRFVLAEYAAEASCDLWHSSDGWPTLWVSQQEEGAQSDN